MCETYVILPGDVEGHHTRQEPEENEARQRAQAGERDGHGERLDS